MHYWSDNRVGVGIIGTPLLAPKAFDALSVPTPFDELELCDTQLYKYSYLANG